MPHGAKPLDRNGNNTDNNNNNNNDNNGKSGNGAGVTGRMNACWQVVIRRGRLCVPVRTARQSEVPKGSMRLGQSTSGATLYMEPAPIVPFNNAEARLSDAVAAEESRVLRRLTRAVAKHGVIIHKVVEQTHVHRRACPSLKLSINAPSPGSTW